MYVDTNTCVLVPSAVIIHTINCILIQVPVYVYEDVYIDTSMCMWVPLTVHGYKYVYIHTINRILIQVPVYVYEYVYIH